MRMLVVAILLIQALNAFSSGEKETQAAPASSKPGFGIGIILGEPSGINAKLFLHPAAAFDAGAAWSFVDPASLVFYGDYLFHFFGLVEIPYGDFGFYCGVGGLANVRNDGVFAFLRIPLGVTYLLDRAPIDIFLEIVPAMQLFPQTKMRGFGGIGVRYWFK